jgi:hypothetical protein
MDTVILGLLITILVLLVICIGMYIYFFWQYGLRNEVDENHALI